MDAREKVLTSLRDSMQKKLAQGQGNKKVDPSKELEKAKANVVEDTVEETKEESLFDKFLKSSRDSKPKPKRVEISMSIAKSNPPKKGKK